MLSSFPSLLAFAIPAPFNQLNIATFEFMKWVAAFANPYMNIAMHLLASSFIIVLPAIVLYMFFAKKDMNAYSFVVAFIAAYLLSEIIKMAVKEPRPCNVPSLNWINSIGCEATFSFPSNHASVLTGLSFFLSGYKYIKWLYVAWLLLVLFGRVYLGMHYLTDIIAGVALSIVVYLAIKHYSKKINAFANNLVKRIFPKLALK